ncbi:helix-turn-helix transcriptional regulator [Sphingomonas sp. CCH15-F11]|uniref:helix-turn-helix transcriptional regulator n=1 Tax=Sphingomonas sp. CCH15-F11 TaxID=1768785 RepID=UPI0012E3A2C6|nr:LuxR C-terminal-related transcriptional regulator [Sphingomonas sp. CCH15-F11]
MVRIMFPRGCAVSNDEAVQHGGNSPVLVGQHALISSHSPNKTMTTAARSQSNQAAHDASSELCTLLFADPAELASSEPRTLLVDPSDATEPRRTSIAEAVALEWLRLDAPCRIILNDDLSLCWAHQQLADLLSRHADVQVRDDMLCFTSADLRQRFVTFVSSLDHEPQVFVARGEASPSILLMRCRKVGLRQAVFLCIELRALAGFEAQFGGMNEVFGLTPAEHRVLCLALRGNDAAAIAAVCGVSVATIRSQLQQIYGKTGSSSREQLFSRLAPFCFY